MPNAIPFSSTVCFKSSKGVKKRVTLPPGSVGEMKLNLLQDVAVKRRKIDLFSLFVGY